MMMQQKRYGPGSIVQVESCFGRYPLPAGLPEGATVKVLEVDYGSCHVEYNGQTIRVSTTNIECGWLFLLNGRWLDEADPRVIAEHKREEELRNRQRNQIASHGSLLNLH